MVRIHSPPPNLTLYDDKTNVYQFLTCGCSSVVEPRPSKPVARVRSPSPAPDDPLAQSAEHLTFNQGVPRSSRGWVTSLRPLGQAVKTPPFHGGNRGSIPLGVTICGLIAQLGEHLPYKQGVTGSSPVGPTTCGCGGIGRRTRLRI